MKKIKRICFTIFMMLICTKIKAGSASMNSTAYTVTVGNTVTVTVNTRNLGGTYTMYSSDQSVLLGDPKTDDVFGSSNTISVPYKAIKAGTATIFFKSTGDCMLSDISSDQCYNDTLSININVVNKGSSGNSNNGNSNSKKPIDINKKYSSDNYLKFLDVDDYDITPKFDKDTLEYKLDLDSDVTKINIKAEANDENANIKGIGEVAVSEGINTINIVVTAENGNERTYKIIANVEDKKPIKVKIGKKQYTVVKSKEALGTREGYIEKEIEIKGIKVPALYNEITKVTLVGLKDDKGKIKLYSYDTKNGKYSVYNEFKFDIMNLYIHNAPKNKYKKTKIKINDSEITAYKIKGVDDYYLLYATNMSTGYEGYYLYDSKENSVQRYNEEMLSKVMSEKNKYFTIVIVLSCVCFLCMAFMLIQLNKGKK